MASFIKKTGLLITSLVILVIPQMSHAALQQYLVVTGTYSKGVFSGMSAEGQAIDDQTVTIYPSGTYKVVLYDAIGQIGANFLEIPTGGAVEVMKTATKNSKQSFAEKPATQTSIHVVVPIVIPSALADASIRIEKSGAVVFDSKLSAMNLSMVTVPPPPVVVSNDSVAHGTIDLPIADAPSGSGVASTVAKNSGTTGILITTGSLLVGGLLILVVLRLKK